MLPTPFKKHILKTYISNSSIPLLPLTTRIFSAVEDIFLINELVFFQNSLAIVNQQIGKFCYLIFRIENNKFEELKVHKNEIQRITALTKNNVMQYLESITESTPFGSVVMYNVMNEIIVEEEAYRKEALIRIQNYFNLNNCSNYEKKEESRDKKFKNINNLCNDEKIYDFNHLQIGDEEYTKRFVNNSIMPIKKIENDIKILSKNKTSPLKMASKKTNVNNEFNILKILNRNDKDIKIIDDKNEINSFEKAKKFVKEEDQKFYENFKVVKDESKRKFSKDEKRQSVNEEKRKFSFDDKRKISRDEKNFNTLNEDLKKNVNPINKLRNAKKPENETLTKLNKIVNVSKTCENDNKNSFVALNGNKFEKKEEEAKPVINKIEIPVKKEKKINGTLIYIKGYDENICILFDIYLFLNSFNSFLSIDKVSLQDLGKEFLDFNGDFIYKLNLKLFNLLGNEKKKNSKEFIEFVKYAIENVYEEKNYVKEINIITKNIKNENETNKSNFDKNIKNEKKIIESNLEKNKKKETDLITKNSNNKEKEIDEEKINDIEKNIDLKKEEINILNSVNNKLNIKIMNENSNIVENIKIYFKATWHNSRITKENWKSCIINFINDMHLNYNINKILFFEDFISFNLKNKLLFYKFLFDILVQSEIFKDFIDKISDNIKNKEKIRNEINLKIKNKKAEESKIFFDLNNDLNKNNLQVKNLKENLENKEDVNIKNENFKKLIKNEKNNDTMKNENSIDKINDNSINKINENSIDKINENTNDSKCSNNNSSFNNKKINNTATENNENKKESRQNNLIKRGIRLIYDNKNEISNIDNKNDNNENNKEIPLSKDLNEEKINEMVNDLICKNEKLNSQIEIEKQKNEIYFRRCNEEILEIEKFILRNRYRIFIGKIDNSTYYFIDDNVYFTLKNNVYLLEPEMFDLICKRGRLYNSRDTYFFITTIKNIKSVFEY